MDASLGLTLGTLGLPTVTALFVHCGAVSFFVRHSDLQFSEGNYNQSIQDHFWPPLVDFSLYPHNNDI